jgi:Ca2+-binding EF-hand superfamily protein
MKKSTIAIAAFAVFAAAPAFAQSNDPYALMMSADADGDGKVSRDELIASRDQMFAKLDRNSDGVLDEADRRKTRPRIASMQTARIDEIKKDFDANGDGAVTKEEFVNGPTPLFDRADADADGFVTKEEAKAAKAAA